MENQGHVIGIDLGTTNSVVAVFEAGQPRIIPNQEGQPRTPSVVAVMEDGSVVVGEIARRQAATQAERTISSVKRLIGRSYQEVMEEAELFPFALAEAEDGRVLIKITDQTFLPEELSSQVLMKLKEAAEQYLDEEVKRAVITVPAYFDDRQRQATMEAAQMAGLDVLRLLNEPTAAAMAYGLGREAHELVAVYDFGGGTFDFSLLEIDHNAFEVLVSIGDSRLGGDDLDSVLMDHLAEAFLDDHGIDLRQEMVTLRRLKDAAEKAKCELSVAQETLVSLPFISYNEGQPLHLEIAVTREELERLIAPLVQDTLNCVQRGLRQTKLRRSDITKVILVGGSTRIPLVQDSVEEYFGCPPFKGLNPDEIVAAGAATQGGVLNGELDEVVLLDVTPHNLGVEIQGNRMSTIVEKNSTIPIKVFKAFTTTQADQTFVNIHVLQGESDKASECRSIGKFTLSGIQEAPSGVPRVRVTFFINADGIVEISATDMQSGAERGLKINHAYLNAAERKAQQTGAHPRRRLRTAARVADTQPRPRKGKTSRDGTGGDTGKRNRLARAQAEAPQGVLDPEKAAIEAHQQLVSSFAEIEGDPVSATLQSAKSTPPPAPPQPRAPQRPTRQPTLTSSQAPTEVDGAARRAARERPSPRPRAAEPVGAGQARPANRKMAEAAETQDLQGRAARKQSAAAAAPESPQGAPPVLTMPEPSITIPPELEPIIRQLARDCADAATCQLYANLRESFHGFCQAHPDDLGLQMLAVKFSIFMKHAEAAREQLNQMRARYPQSASSLLRLFGLLSEHFPNYAPAHKDRAALAMELGEHRIAMQELEAIVEQDESSDDVQRQLQEVYESIIRKSPDATVQFKLVKFHLRRQELDSAIGLLQQLVTNPNYRDRANKVLGLCFWQKGMRYLAWQRFRSLPLDVEMKDILYRLAGDMEENDELLHAKYCLERIYEVDINYQDVSGRMKKLNYRLELQKDEKYGGINAGGAGAAVEPGSELGGRFEIIGEINRGSMGIVYKARDKTLDEILAIKVLNDFLCMDPQAVERFKLEARAARKLTHQNIVRIHDMFDLDGKKIISMEYIEGENLKTLLSRHVTFTEEIILTYLVQICEGLAYAHRQDLVHRDIKPANIMITDHNLVKITDFGIAKILTDHQTKAGTMIMGTPLYMAPEQIEGGKIDNRCDIYALGIMMYEMVTGRPPFSDGNIEYQHIHAKPPQITAGISDKVRSVIMKCIEKKPDDRYQSTEEILARII